MAGDRTSLRIYRALLRLYPTAFRERFGDQMVQLLGDQLRDAGGAPGGSARVWLRTLGDLAMTAASERARDDRAVALSVVPPSPTSRLLGLAGIAGGVVLLAAFVVEIPPDLNLGRLILFNVGSMAIALAVHRRQASRAPRLSAAVAAAVILANAWYVAMLLLAIGRPVFPEPDPEFRRIAFYAGAAMWFADATFGLAAYRLRVVSPWAGLALAIGTVLGFLGMGNLELVSGPYGWFFTPLALGGIGLAGIAWILLGAGVILPRPTRINDASS